MGEAYRGLTIRFAADGTKVMSTLKAMRRAGADVESELRLVNRALKFDGANGNTASRQLQLMAERAAAAGGEANRLRKELRILGNQEIGGKRMRELSKETKDASTQASLMRERYNAATKSLAELQNEAEQLWYTSKNLGVMPNPFTGWSDMPTEKIQEFMAMLFRTGDINMATWKRMSSAVKELRAEFNLTEGELKKLNHIAEFQSAEDKLRQLEAAAMRYRNTLRDAALQARETGQEFNLSRASASLERTSAAAKRLQEAMRLDPKSFEAAIGHAKMLKAEMDAVEGSSDALRAEIKQLEAMPGVKELANDARKLQEEFIASGKAVDLAAEKLGKAAAAADRLEEAAGELRSKLAAAGETAGEKLQNQVRNTEEAAKAARLEANRLQEEFDQAAKSAEKVNAALRVTDNRSQIAANNAKMQAMNQKQAKKNAMSTSAMTSLGMSMYATVYPAAMMAGSYAIQAAQEVDSAYRDMRKTVQGTETDFENLKRKALEFGDTHVTSADQILEFEAMGGQLGIVVDDLEAFSTTVANLDIATNMDSDEIALDLGKMANILGISAEEYDNFADALVRLGNSEPALESDIMAITARFGAMAHIVGMTPDQILAIATAATATGQKAEAAGGSLQRLLGGIETKVAGVSEAMKELDWEGEDLEEFQEAAGNLEAFANVAGMSAAQFAEAWEHDAAGAFQKFIEGLKKYGDEGGSVQELLYDKLGYHNIRDLQLLQGLTNTTQVMTESLSMAANAYDGISDQYGTAGDAANEAAKKAEGFSGQLQILKNNGQHMADMLGESLVPVMKELTGIVQGGVRFFENAGDGAKTLALGLVGLGVASGPLLTMWAAGRNALGSLKKSIGEYTSVAATTERINRSQIMTQHGLGSIYVSNGKAIEQNTRIMQGYQSRQAAIVGTSKKELEQSRMLTEQRQKLARENAKMQRTNTMISAGATGLGALKSLGSMAGWAAGAVVLEQVISKLVEMKDKADALRESTEGISSISDRIKNMDSEIESGVGKMGMSMEDSGRRMLEVGRASDELTRSTADFYRQAQAGLDDMSKNAILAEYWSNRVVELSSSFDGSQASLNQLKNAVQQYNEITGSNIKVVDDSTGRLNANTNEILANTAAFKESIKAKAIASVAEESAKKEAELTAQLELENQAWEKRDEQLRANGTSSEAEAAQYMQEKSAHEERVKNLQKEIEAQAQLSEVSFDAAEKQAELAKDAAKSSKEQKEAAHSAKAYSDALKDVGGNEAFEDISEHAFGTRDATEELAKALSEAGIETESLADMGVDSFNQLYDACSGDFDKINVVINNLNALGISPKEVEFIDSTSFKVKNHVIDLQNQTIDDKKFEVSDDGTITAADKKTQDLLNELGILGRKVAKPTVKVNDQASDKISDVKSKLSALDGVTATATTFVNTVHTKIEKIVKEGESATGGISRTPLYRKIPKHADGGLSGIVTRATLTNQGWVGEDGDEALIRQGRSTAIVPLSNHRYVRPFARAVASEMGGSSRTEVHNHNTYYLNANAVTDARVISAVETIVDRAEQYQEAM